MSAIVQPTVEKKAVRELKLLSTTGRSKSTERYHCNCRCGERSSVRQAVTK